LKALQNGYGVLLEASIFKSAYYEVLEKEPEYSTSKWRQGGAQLKKIKPAIEKSDGDELEDYIFYLGDFFKAKSVLSIPPIGEVIKRSGGNLLPDWGCPSDHFYILADLEYQWLKRKKSTRAAGERRRMAQREFSDRRDSPVMVRLLQEIVDAQDEK